jgi:hypothetical protein
MTTDRNTGHRISLGDQSQATLLKLLWMGSNILFILGFIWIASNQHIAANKPPTPYVIAESGEKIAIKEATSDEERNSVIQGFIDETFVGLFTWKSDLPPSNLRESNKTLPDTGIPVINEQGEEIFIPTISFVSTLALELNLAKAQQQEIAKYVSQYKIGPGNDKTVTVFVPRQTSIPISTGSDTWLVNIVGEQLIISKGKTTVVSHAYQATVRTARILTLSDAMKRYKDLDLAKFIVKARSSGLEITKIIPLQGI